MSEAVRFPDAEAVAVAYLLGALGAREDTAVVSTAVPNPHPGRLVKVTRTGGVRLDLVRDRAQLTFDCWDPDEVAASDLAALVRALVGVMPDADLPGGVTAYRHREFAGPVNLPDPKSSHPRYRFTSSLDLRGVPLEP